MVGLGCLLVVCVQKLVVVVSADASLNPWGFAMGNLIRAAGATLLAAWPVLKCSSKVDVLRLVPQAVAALGKVAAPTPRQDYEPTLRLLCSDNNLVQFGHLLFRQVASEEGGRLPAGGIVLEGLDFGQTEAHPFGVGDELQLLQRTDVITPAAGYASCQRQESDLFVVS